MKLIVRDTYEAMSQQAASDIAQITQSLTAPVFCPASGDTPTALYKAMVTLAKEDKLACKNWWYVGLDEWMHMNGSDAGSCRYYVDKQLFEPLQIDAQRVCFFNGRAADAVAECERVEAFVAEHKGIDVAILGLGLNGHIGMNEPGTAASARSHVSQLDVQTQQVGQKYFAEPTAITSGLTLGIATLKEAKHILLLVSGARKANIVKQVVEGEVSEAVPATLLRDHPGFTIYLDKDAAQFLEGR